MTVSTYVVLEDLPYLDKAFEAEQTRSYTPP